MPKTNYEIVSESLMMALQDLDCPDMEKEELEAAVSVAEAKSKVVLSLARYQKTLIEAEKLRLKYGESASADAMVGIENKGEEKNTYRLEAK